MSKALNLINEAENTQLAILREELQNAQNRLDQAGFTTERLQERLQHLDLMLDMRGWTEIGQYQEEGPSLVQLKSASKELRNLVALNSTIKRGSQLRISYVWSKGMEFTDVPDTSDGRRKTANVQELIDSPMNQKYVFSGEAHEELERCAYTDGWLGILASEGDKALTRVPISQITADFRNPDNPEEIWAYRREWTSYATSTTGDKTVRWYFTDLFADKRSATIRYAEKSEAVDQEALIIDQTFNRQVGWGYGVPDALSAMSWAKLYRDSLVNGKIVTDAMAQLWAVAKNGSRDASEGAGMRLADRSGGSAGGVAMMGLASEFSPLSTAGKGYDYASARPLAAQIATAIEVSIVHLLSDPGAAGSSYGSAANLDLPTKRAIVSRQNLWRGFFKRVLKFLGAPDAGVTFPSLDDPDPYREMQIATLAFGTGEIHHDEIRPRLLELANLIKRHETPPAGVMYPNNEESLARRDIDTDAGGNPANGGSVSPSQGSPASSGGGKGMNANDLRTDTIEALAKIAGDRDRERMFELLEEIRAKLSEA